ncbi:MAG: alpha-amylase family glycosyl hydrolase [Fimbriimonas sp.]
MILLLLATITTPPALPPSGPPILRSSAPPQSQISHTFTYEASPLVKKVNIAGSFNGWSKTANEMRHIPGTNTWTSTHKLSLGKHTYKFVLDDDRWITDPKAKSEDDGNGNINSVLILTPLDYKTPASRTDNIIAVSALSHASNVPDFNWDRGKLTITFTARPNDIGQVFVVANGKPIQMKSVASDELYERYRAQVPWNRKQDLDYFFLLLGGEAKAFGTNGLTDGAKPFHVSAKTYKPFTVPTWVEKTVLYQIFPDRFANGDKANDPKDVQPWNAKPTYYNRFGGDVAGIEQHLGYLKDLGIGGIYFNPVFKSISNHRYQAVDYKQIDPEFGTNQEFSALTKDLKKAGIRTILDGVFNHTAPEFFAFADVVKNGAASKYKDWYWFHSFPVKVGPNPNYDCWWGAPSMPKLNVLQPDAKKYLLSVPTFWQSEASIDGWRLDVANEVAMDFWRDFRKAVKANNPNAWIVGEHWGDSSPWLGGDQWDATMNYLFRDAVLHLVHKDRSGKPSLFMDRLMNTYSLYAPQVSRNLMNLLGSHDTARILTEVGGDKDLAKMAAIIQFTWIGTPCIYYGDELGMEGGPDPDNRRGMDWSLAASPNAQRPTPNALSSGPNTQHPIPNTFQSLYKKLIALRKASPLLQAGEPIKLLADDATQTAAYARILGNQVAVVALNRSTHPRTITLRLPNTQYPTPNTSLRPNSQQPTTNTQNFTNALTGKPHQASPNGTISIQLAPKQAAILMPRSGNNVSSTPRPGPRPSAFVHRSTIHHVA